MLALLNEVATQPLVQQALADEDGDVGYSKVSRSRSIACVWERRPARSVDLCAGWVSKRRTLGCCS
eukprot:6631126-Ditylum_brightwellii.AAC.1